MNNMKAVSLSHFLSPAMFISSHSSYADLNVVFLKIIGEAMVTLDKGITVMCDYVLASYTNNVFTGI